MKRTATKLEMDLRIAAFHDRSGKEVASITRAFCDEIVSHLLEGEEVHIRGFGTFRMQAKKGKHLKVTGGKMGTELVETKKYYVSFRRADSFRQKLRKRLGKEIQ